MKYLSKAIKLPLLSLFIIFLTSSMALALPYYFDNITNNSGIASDIADQLYVDVVDSGAGTVSFVFYNTGPIASSITDIYFDDGSLLGITAIVNSTGTAFSSPADPADLPGGGTVGFVTTAGFSADSDPPVSANGVNPGELVTIVFNLQSGMTFANVLADLASGNLMIGLHVQSIGTSGDSDSFVNDGDGNGTPVPEPGTLLLLGSGLIGLWGFRKKFRK